MSIPLQHNADMDSPEEHLLWALVNIGGLAGAPLLMPVSVMREWSKHLYKCGFRHDASKQEIFYRPPGPDASIWDGLSGVWVESDSPGESPISESDDELDELLAGMDSVLKDELRRRLNGGS